MLCREVDRIRGASELPPGGRGRADGRRGKSCPCPWARGEKAPQGGGQLRGAWDHRVLSPLRRDAEQPEALSSNADLLGPHPKEREPQRLLLAWAHKGFVKGGSRGRDR